jgi:tetratricopeptide (TPR) repeat protein
VRLESDNAGLRYFLAELYVDRVRERFVAASVEGADAASYEVDRLPEEARDAARVDLERATGHLRAALEQAPDFLGGWVELAGVSAGLGRRGDAIDQLERALAIAADAHDLRLYRARLLAADGRAGEAVTEYDHLAGGAAPGIATAARFEAARVLERAGEAAAARPRFEALASSNEGVSQDQRAAATLHLGNLDLNAGDLAAAERRYRAALELDFELVEARFNLATLLGRAGRFAEAAAENARVVELQPANHEARFGQAMALVLAGEHAAAVERLQLALELYPSGAGYAHLLARVLVAAPDDAVRDGQVGLDLARRLFEALPSPEHAETLAMALAEVGRFDQAVEWQQRVVEELVKAGGEVLAGSARQRLEAYRRGEPARSPWD